jgi:hypothetical protein
MSNEFDHAAVQQNSNYSWLRAHDLNPRSLAVLK